ncbi:hypothetical protein HPB47_003480 [Ixodes persulcatus]|uniref:Uncharacterized protein n=1 Tax=Ixodes persulcatus TaxID=34615 RepID=A0AC60PJF5_IXOPE|nr:hypothetical protein HPB47_003480 [Ixodes persulcatus]
MVRSLLFSALSLCLMPAVQCQKEKVYDSCSQKLIKVPCAYVVTDEDTWCPLLEEDWQIQFDDRLSEGAVAISDDWQILFGDAWWHVQSGDSRRRRFGREDAADVALIMVAKAAAAVVLRAAIF